MESRRVEDWHRSPENRNCPLSGTSEWFWVQSQLELVCFSHKPFYSHFTVAGFSVHAKSLQSRPTLYDPMDCSPPGSSVHGESPGTNTGVGCHALLLGIFPSQGSNPGLPHCRRILYQLSHQGSPQLRVVIVFAASLCFPSHLSHWLCLQCQLMRVTGRRSPEGRRPALK